MHRIHTIVLCAIVLGLTLLQVGMAQQPIPPYEKLIGPSAVVGEEYWIAIPPNEIPGYPTIALEIYVASEFDTEVHVFEAETGKFFKKSIKKGEIRTLSDSRGETNWAWEIRNTEVVENKGVRLTSKMPISVYVLNSKVFSSDGYMALPTKLWDTNYVSVSYYDFKEVNDWAGGFVVIARENNTKVTIDLKGTGGTSAKTSGGKANNAGTPFTVTLDEGQTYMVHGDGSTRGVFDLTGTRITSSKPIGVIGFHHRTTMPNMLTNGNGRNHLVEMIPPVSAWGRQYVTVELSRNHLGRGKGDMFRVVASEPQTQLRYAYYDKDTKALIKSGEELLLQAGDFVDFSQSADPIVLPYGVSMWTADKPMYVAQYSCSSSWDGNLTLDPFMLNLTPIDQFTTRTIFQFPTVSAFTSHKLNLIVQARTSGAGLIEDLKSLQIDGKPVWSHSNAIAPKLLFNHITGTDLYWTTLDFQSDAASHTITCNDSIRFGGYIYGYGQTDAYGWPLAAMSYDLSDTTKVDGLPPVLTKVGTTEKMMFTATEAAMPVDPSNPAPQARTQSPTGIAAVDILDPQPNFITSNYELMLTSDNSPCRVMASKLVTFELNVVDPSEDAVAYFYVMDWAGNIRYDSLRYTVPEILDTMPPVFLKVSTAVRLNVTATERRNIPDPPRLPAQTGDQVETGLAAIGLVDADSLRASVNYTLTFETDTTLQHIPLYKTFAFTLTVQDTTKPARAYYYATDGAGNTTVDSVSYKPAITTDVADARTGDHSFTLAAFHNPALGLCTLRWTAVGASAVGTIRITDLQGRLVWEGSTVEGATEAAIPTSALASGTYIIGLVIDGHAAGTTLQLHR
jgi:hypothetical protein